MPLGATPARKGFAAVCDPELLTDRLTGRRGTTLVLEHTFAALRVVMHAMTACETGSEPALLGPGSSAGGRS